MKLRLLFALPALLLASLLSQAQTYEPGLLVRSIGDTLRGEIENSFWVEPPEFIRFRATPDSPGQLFQPRQLRAVSFTGGRAFLYKGLPINHAARAKVGDLPYGNRPDVQVDSLLAEVLVDGPVILVRVAQFDRPVHYLLLSAGRPPLDLSEQRYLRQTVDYAWLLTDGNNYRGQLSVYFGNCPAAHSVVQKTSFTAKDLVAVVQTYNEACAHQLGSNLFEQATSRHRVAFQGGLLAGMRYNRIESSSLRYQGKCTDCRPRPYAGLYGELLQAGRTMAVYGELSLSKFHSHGSEYVGYNAAGIEQFNDFEYSAWLTTARIGMRYFIGLSHERQVFVAVGYELNFISGAIITPDKVGTALTDPQLYYATPVLFPNVSLGWRRQRLTISLDGQMYASSDITGTTNTTPRGLGQAARFEGPLFFGTNFVARAGIAYRLGRNPDKPTR